ncbi:MAG: Ada metal-binding domain-containing protein [Pseudomonadota bacterium]|nr:Ada metal-binding domain-containing protein [Pseudomonadota bacterium]
MGCPAGRRMYRSSRVFFADATAAEAAGYRPCARCCRAAYDV